MTELLEIYFLSSDIRTCFFYRKSVDSLNERLGQAWPIEIRHGPNFEVVTYGSISLQAVPQVPDKCLGVSSLLADKLKLKEKDQVLISTVRSYPVQSLEISPTREEDYIILLSCKRFIEENMLNQVRVVSPGQTLPLHIFSNIIVDIQIGKINPNGNYGQLEKLTQVAILQTSLLSVPNLNSPDSGAENPSRYLFTNINQILTSTVRTPKAGGTVFPPFDEPSNEEYTILSTATLPANVPTHILDKFMIINGMVSNAQRNSFGSHSLKVPCRVSCKVNDHSLGSISHLEEAQRISCYAVSFDNASRTGGTVRGAFCPSHIMKQLGVFVGDRVKIEMVRAKDEGFFPLARKEVASAEQESPLPESMRAVKEKIINNIINNIKHGWKLNSLVIGGVGTGKTYLMKSLVGWHKSEFIFNEWIDCRRLRGKKVETLYSALRQSLGRCCRHEPSTLFLDDLEALTHFEEEEEQFNKAYCERVQGVISECIMSVQERFRVFVVATSTGWRELGGLVSSRGALLFPCMESVPDLTVMDRLHALRYIFERKIRGVKKGVLKLDKIANATNGYTIQDLCDLAHKATMRCLMAGRGVLSQEDLNSGLSASVPLTLRGVVGRKGRNCWKWGEIGGMEGPKKVLTEVFSWPAKYPEVLESCPLRLQKGVLLYGVPGTGKTLLAGALADECGLNFMSVKGPEVLSKYVGASEEGVRNLFLQAQKKRPCLLFFDEFDSLAPKRGHDSTGVTDRVVNQLLTQLDGVEALEGVWILAATSRPDLIDPALLRPGRLDKIVFCDLPVQAARSSILQALSRNLSMSEDVDLFEISRMTQGWTGADLQAVLTNAHISAVKDGSKVVGQGHLLDSYHVTKPSLSDSEKARYGRIYRKFLNSRKKNSGIRYEEMGQKVTLA